VTEATYWILVSGDEDWEIHTQLRAEYKEAREEARRIKSILNVPTLLAEIGFHEVIV